VKQNGSINVSRDRIGMKEVRTMFEVTARLKVRDGELEGFKRQAAEIMRQAKAKDTETLRYDWFLSDDGTQCEVREGYVDADALLDHSEHIGEARAKLFRDFAYDHDMTIYGEPSPALADAFAAMADHVTSHRYSLFQGLDAVGEAPYGLSPDGATDDARFEASARLRLRDGELEGFKRQAAVIMRLTLEQDAKPLRYDWFLSDDGTECEVREAYVTADALLEQQRRIGEAKATLFGFVTDHTMTFYDAPTPALAAALKAMGTNFTQFFYFQGLGGDVRVPRAVVPA
jgi:quinol monooxygenase YgiN